MNRATYKCKRKRHFMIMLLLLTLTIISTISYAADESQSQKSCQRTNGSYEAPGTQLKIHTVINGEVVHERTVKCNNGTWDIIWRRETYTEPPHESVYITFDEEYYDLGEDVEVYESEPTTNTDSITFDEDHAYHLP